MAAMGGVARVAEAIACDGLTKVYATGAIALDNLTLTIPHGASFGLLGENGAGKSTLVRLLMGFIFPTSGELRVLGETEVRRAHPRIGYLHERPYPELRLTARRYLAYMGELSGLWGADNRRRVDATLARVDLTGAANARIATYSKGMAQRLGIAQALLADPRLLVLDEPTSGLDPYSQWAVRRTITGLRTQGVTILLCSHDLAEVEALCDEVGVLSHGRLVRAGALADLIRADASGDVVDIVLEEGEPAGEVVARLGLDARVIAADGARLRVAAPDQVEVLAALVAARTPIHSLNPARRTLEDVYLDATGKK